jgi:hypothetical protein
MVTVLLQRVNAVIHKCSYVNWIQRFSPEAMDYPYECNPLPLNCFPTINFNITFPPTDMFS